MCFSQPKVDTTIQQQQQQEAEAARRREEQRQARIERGTMRVDKAFGQFDDNFFQKRQNEYMGYYTPQLDDQFKKAQDSLTYAFARNGTLNSTMAADKQSELKSKYDTEQAGLLSQAKADVAQTQGRINGEKSALVSQLQSTADANRAANDATARTQQMFSEVPAYNSLGDIFSGVTGSVANYYNGRDAGTAYNTYFGANSARTGNTTRTVY